MLKIKKLILDFWKLFICFAKIKYIKCENPIKLNRFIIILSNSYFEKFSKLWSIHV